MSRRIDPKDYENPYEICRFPKHFGVPWEVVVEEDRAYVEWLVYDDETPINDHLYEVLMDLLEGD